MAKTIYFYKYIENIVAGMSYTLAFSDQQSM